MINKSQLQDLQAITSKYNARLVAVSKTKSPEEIMEVHKSGHKIFGENKAQELAEKYEQLPKDIEWHMIGHLQRNKVKYIIPFVRLIHSVDSLKLLKEIDKQAAKINKVQDCLLQVFIAKEETKFGFNEPELIELFESGKLGDPDIGTEQVIQHVRICGVMGIATFTEEEQMIRSEFQSLRRVFQNLKEKYFADAPHFKEISMGMSGDYQIALEEGSTIIRVGSLIFGERNY